MFINLHTDTTFYSSRKKNCYTVFAGQNTYNTHCYTTLLNSVIEPLLIDIPSLGKFGKK